MEVARGGEVGDLRGEEVDVLEAREVGGRVLLDLVRGRRACG
jgi:hypothetical protein